jgi:hypothetical protein
VEYCQSAEKAETFWRHHPPAPRWRSDLTIKFPPSDEEADGTLLADCVGSVKTLSIVGPKVGLVNETSLVTGMAASQPVLKKLKLFNSKIDEGLDHGTVARLLSSLQSLTIAKGGHSFAPYTAHLFRAISSPDSKLSRLWLGGRSAGQVREMPPGDLVAAVSRLQVFTIHRLDV